MYAEKPRTITKLKEAIREKMRLIPNSVCKNVMDNFLLCLKKCTDLNGGRLEHMLLHDEKRPKTLVFLFHSDETLRNGA